MDQDLRPCAAGFSVRPRQRKLPSPIRRRGADRLI